MEYSGTRLFWTGMLVCGECYDTPQPQFLTPILPGDPKPLINPRPEYFNLIRGQDNFALYTLWAPDVGTLRSESQLMQSKASVLAAVAKLSGVETPEGYVDESGSVGTSAAQIVPANAPRNWLVIFNPMAQPVVVSTGNAAFAGDPNAVLLGAGCALLCATAAPFPVIPPPFGGGEGGGADDERGGLANLYTGAMTAVSQLPGSQLWIFEQPGALMGGPPIPVVMP